MSVWLFIYILSKILYDNCVFLSSYSSSSKLPEPKQEIMGTPIYSLLIRSLCTTTRGLQLACEVGGGKYSCGTQLSTCGIWCYLQVDWVNQRTPRWCLMGTLLSKASLICWRNIPTYLVWEVFNEYRKTHLVFYFLFSPLYPWQCSKTKQSNEQYKKKKTHTSLVSVGGHRIIIWKYFKGKIINNLSCLPQILEEGKFSIKEFQVTNAEGMVESITAL